LKLVKSRETLIALNAQAGERLVHVLIRCQRIYGAEKFLFNKLNRNFSASDRRNQTIQPPE